MTREHLFDAITNVKDTLVEEARHTRPAKKQVNWMKWGSIAAAAALVIGVGGWALSQWRTGSGAFNAPGSSSAGGSGHDDGSTVFMHYGGPVFPMTTIEGGEGLEAERHLIYDFSRRTSSRRSGYLLVTDSYTLTNSTEEDKTITVLYPFVSALYELYEDIPVLQADGAELQTALHAGGYSGGFQGVPDGSGQVSEELLNLEQLDSWEDYKALLSDGRYLEQALGSYPDLSGTPVIVYKFFDSYGPEPDSKAVPNPSIRAGFDLDYDRTTVLSYGFHGASWDRENGKMIQEFSIPRTGSRNYGEPYFLFVIGDDIRDLTTGGYVTGGTDPDTKTLDNCGVSVERYESDLESALRTAAELMYNGWDDWGGQIGESRQADFEMYFGLMKEFLCSYGALSESDVARYDTGWLEFMDFTVVDRVFYLESSVTIPTGGSVTVEASFTKEPSYDHYCAHTENQGISGYDMVTKLGTNLDFTAQTAEAVNTEAVEIVRQNYGFDWENGVNKVTLDQGVEHYYLEVRKLAD